ncbi:TPR repeat protein [Rhodoligotrophos appendicifer]|uniref:tetratricopeptide repeat protein n=1 Tax=Rhodoligotrophos appendicifer TaxID=987056 RepID=UPI0011865628|nr:tetratricopeptide repeat protein [Rhodoligotrophos appendicifer]
MRLAYFLGALMLVNQVLPVAAADKCDTGESLGANSVLAQKGNDVAQCAMGRAYETGAGVKLDLRRAAALYQSSANKGNVEAQYRLGLLLEKGGDKLPADPAFAVSMYQTAARYGQAGAQYRLGFALQYGTGIDKNAEQAVIWYRRAAEQGLAEAQNSLGLMYLSGTGVKRNYKQAAKYFKQAADQGYGWAQNNLAGLYELGWGTNTDLTLAKRYYSAAASKDNPAAKQNLERLDRIADAGTPMPSAMGDPAGPKKNSPIAADEVPMDFIPRN